MAFNAIDPGHRDSVASKFLGELDELLGPGGKLEGVLEISTRRRTGRASPGSPPSSRTSSPSCAI